MAFKLTERWKRLVAALKWIGCCTALPFALTGLVLDVASFGDAHQLLGRTALVVAAIAMAVGLAGAVLDRTDTLS